MQTNNGSTTHTITIAEPPNRAFRFLIGCAILYAVWRCRERIADFLTFQIFAAFDATPAAFEVTTVTGTVLPLLIEFVIGLGGIGVFVFSLGWSVVVDLFAGAVSTISVFRQRMAATAAAKDAATMAATIATNASATRAGAIAAVDAATNAASGPRVAITDPQLLEFARLVQNTFREQRAELKTISETIDRLEKTTKPTKPTAATRKRGPSA